MASEPLTPREDAREFLLTWLFEHLNKQGLIDAAQLKMDLLCMVEHPEIDRAGSEAYQSWVNEFQLIGVLPADAE